MSSYMRLGNSSVDDAQLPRHHHHDDDARSAPTPVDRATRRRARARCAAFAAALLFGVVLLTQLLSSQESYRGAVAAASEFAASHNPFRGDRDGLESILGVKNDAKSVEGFTIVTPTFKRDDMIPSFLSHYANSTNPPPSLHRIVLLWAEFTRPPPPWLLESLPKYPTPVVLRVPQTSSLNERFRPADDVETESVLELDDDIRISMVHLEQGYLAWKKFGGGRRRMVGYIEREARDDMSYSWDPLPTYSIVLTKAAFLHVDWHRAYWSPSLAPLREFVDEHKNCEDILMSFLHARHTREPPIYLAAPFQDVGLGKGISSGGSHLATRTACMRRFSEAMGNDTLVATSLQIQVRPGSEKLDVTQIRA